jgi:hypothetical protein
MDAYRSTTYRDIMRLMKQFERFHTRSFELSSVQSKTSEGSAVIVLWGKDAEKHQDALKTHLKTYVANKTITVLDPCETQAAAITTIRNTFNKSYKFVDCQFVDCQDDRCDGVGCFRVHDDRDKVGLVQIAYFAFQAERAKNPLYKVKPCTNGDACMYGSSSKWVLSKCHFLHCTPLEEICARNVKPVRPAQPERAITPKEFVEETDNARKKNPLHRTELCNGACGRSWNQCMFIHDESAEAFKAVGRDLLAEAKSLKEKGWEHKFIQGTIHLRQRVNPLARTSDCLHGDACDRLAIDELQCHYLHPRGRALLEKEGLISTKSVPASAPTKECEQQVLENLFAGFTNQDFSITF